MSRRVVVPAVALILLLVGWEAVVRGFNISDKLLPPPSQIALRLWEFPGYILYHVSNTMMAAVLGFILGVSAAVLLATLFHFSETIRIAILPYTIATRAVPVVAMAPIVLAWTLGHTFIGKLILSAMVSFFPVLVNTMYGLEEVEQEEIDLLNTLSASRWRQFRALRFWKAAPAAAAGAKAASAYAVVGCIVAELVSSNAGVGYMYNQSAFYLDIDMTFAVLIAVSLGGLCLYGAVALAERKLIFWRFEQTGGLVRGRAARLLRLHRQHGGPYQVDFHGLRIHMLPEVFCPAYGEGSNLLAQVLDTKEGDRVLKIGTGSGALAILAAKTGAQVVASDFSPLAVRCAKENAERQGLSESIDVRRGDLFESIRDDEKFDLVLFNPPFMEGAPRGPLEGAIYDPGYKTLAGFMRGLRTFLAPGGQALVAFSSVGDMTRFGVLADEVSLKPRLVTEVGGKLKFTVHELRPQAGPIEDPPG